MNSGKEASDRGGEEQILSVPSGFDERSGGGNLKLGAASLEEILVVKKSRENGDDELLGKHGQDAG